MKRKEHYQAKETSSPAMLSFKFLNPVQTHNHYCVLSHTSIPPATPTEAAVQLCCLLCHSSSACHVSNTPCTEGRQPGAAAEKLLWRIITKSEPKPNQWLEPNEVTGKLSVWEFFTLSSEFTGFMEDLVQEPKTRREGLENTATERNKIHHPQTNNDVQKKSLKNIWLTVGQKFI